MLGSFPDRSFHIHSLRIKFNLYLVLFSLYDDELIFIQQTSYLNHYIKLPSDRYSDRWRTETSKMSISKIEFLVMGLGFVGWGFVVRDYFRNVAELW